MRGIRLHCDLLRRGAAPLSGVGLCAQFTADGGSERKALCAVRQHITIEAVAEPLATNGDIAESGMAVTAIRQFR